jgi:putative intracellular protease/amidase
VTRSVLLVVTSHDLLGHSGQGTGAWLEELTQAYYTVADGGFQVDIASPRGGKAPLDPASCAPPWLSEAGKRLLDDAAAMGKMQDTKALASVDPDRYRGVYLVGGAGAVWDMPNSAALGDIISKVLAAGRPVAAVCHGAAGLASARTAEGEPLVKGRRVTAFSNVEEEQVGYVPLLPLLPESLLRSLGADYSCAEPWTECVVTDGMLLTGQNPASAAALARALLKLAS